MFETDPRKTEDDKKIPNYKDLKKQYRSKKILDETNIVSGNIVNCACCDFQSDINSLRRSFLGLFAIILTNFLVLVIVSIFLYYNFGRSRFVANANDLALHVESIQFQLDTDSSYPIVEILVKEKVNNLPGNAE